jgi:sugar O-acyltransferase (sialic acid O-acetyltransferase NeuD family)
MSNSLPNSKFVAVIGFNDGLAGQTAGWFEETTGLEIALFIDESNSIEEFSKPELLKQRPNKRFEYPANDLFMGKPFYSNSDWPSKLIELGIKNVLVLIPDNLKRFEIIKTCTEYGFDLVSAIHPNVEIMSQSAIEPGVWINSGAIIGFKAEVKSGVLINTRAIVEHHTILESCCQLDPAVVIAGNVTIGKCAHIHMGALIKNRTTIGTNAIVGAGAVVLSDVPSDKTVVGIPAKKIQYH